LDNLVSSQAANLGCLITDLAQVSSNVAQPANLMSLSNALADNQYFFGAVNAVVQPGTAKALTSGDKDNPNQLMLRSRLLLPPQSPAADTYPTPTSLPATLPGQACSNQLGTGVPAATQAGK
jgi:hypothetical protein